MPSYSTPSTNLSTGVSTKPTRLVPDYLSKTQIYVPLSVFFAGQREPDADPDSLFGLRMPERQKKAAPPKEKKSRGGNTGGKGEKPKDDDENDKEKEKGAQKGGSGPERAQTAKPRPQQAPAAQAPQQGAQASQGAKQEALARLLDVALNGQSVAHLDEGSLLKPQKCKYCDSSASKAVVHSNAYAYVPVCPEHLNKAKTSVGSEFCYTQLLPQRGAACSNCGEPASFTVYKHRNIKQSCQKCLKRVRGQINATYKYGEPIVKRLPKEEGMTTTANVPTLPVPIGAGDGREFLDRPDDDKRKKKKKKKSLSRSLYVLLRQ